MPRNPKITPSSGNVFADLGFANPQEELDKADLVRAIVKIVKETGLTQAKAAQRVGVDQPTHSKLLRGRTAGFSLERLITILRPLGQDVQITIKPAAPSREGHLSIATLV